MRKSKNAPGQKPLFDELTAICGGGLVQPALPFSEPGAINLLTAEFDDFRRACTVGKERGGFCVSVVAGKQPQLFHVHVRDTKYPEWAIKVAYSELVANAQDEANGCNSRQFADDLHKHLQEMESQA